MVIANDFILVTSALLLKCIIDCNNMQTISLQLPFNKGNLIIFFFLTDVHMHM